MITAVATGESPPSFEDFDRKNAAIYPEHQPLPLEEVMLRSRQAQQYLLTSAGQLEEEMLRDPQRFTWLHGQPRWRRMVGSGLLHPIQYLTRSLAKKGRFERSPARSEQAPKWALQVSEDPDGQGVVPYNLACAYALPKREQKALGRLHKPHCLRPNLSEWSRQQPDLASIRDKSSSPQPDSR